MVGVRDLCVLGATGSVGGAALSLVREHPDRYRVRALAAQGDVAGMAELCREFAPAVAVLADEEKAEVLHKALVGEGVAVMGGAAAVAAAAARPDCCTVLAAISGADGVAPTLSAAVAGKRILLANKEALIVAGDFLWQALAESGGDLLPVDSEHCALFELLGEGRDFERLWLTASGGAVRRTPLAALERVSPQEALNHPNWSMGEKITVDSATLMNKVLEVMEAVSLFSVAPERVGVVMHPQSVVHAFVEYSDGSLQAALSLPDMRLPIARMLAWPDRLPGVCQRPDWGTLSAMTFALPDEERYPCLPLAYRALRLGGGAPAALSAANEVAVRRFLAGEIRFTDIARINAAALDGAPSFEAATMESVWRIDTLARQKAALFA